MDHGAFDSLMECAEVLAWHAGTLDTRDGDQIVREFQFADFVEALGFITQAGVLAERANHHPTITSTYNRVGVALWSHDAGGVTERDLALAAELDARAG